MKNQQIVYYQQLELERIATACVLSRLMRLEVTNTAGKAQQQRMQTKLKRIEKALRRLEAGQFGECQECGGAIHPERLALLPYAELCLNCQRQLERRTIRGWRQ